MTDTDEKKGTFVVRARAVIVVDGKLFVVRHAHDASFAALPGGHMEWGEDVLTCLRREMQEELGVEPSIGRLLYVNTYIENGWKQPVEFFFEILNPRDYLTLGANRTHAHELASIEWVSPADDVHILPEGFAKDFKSGNLFSDTVRYLTT